MKRALSLFLALVMVALMVPFAAIISSATGEAGTGYAPGTVFYHTDFTTLADLSNGQTYSGAELDTILAKAGVAVTADSNTDAVTQLFYDGVFFGGSDQGIKMTAATNLPQNIVNGTEDYVIEVIWDHNSMANLVFGFGTDEQAVNEGSLYTWKGVENSGCAISGFNTFAADGTTAITDSKTPFESGKSDSYYELAISVSDGKIAEIKMSKSGKTVVYKPDGDKAAVGYFRIRHSGWGSSKSVSVRSIKLYAGSYGDDANTNTLGTYYKYDAQVPAATYTPGQVLHNVNMANIANKADLGYDFLTEQRNSDVWLENGELVGTTDASNSGIKLDSDKIFPAGLGTYTIDFNVKFNPRVWIFFVAFGLNDKADYAWNDPYGNSQAVKYGYQDGSSFKFRGDVSQRYALDSAKTYTFDGSEWKEVVYTYTDANDMPARMRGVMPEDVVDALYAGEYANVKIIVDDLSVYEAYITVGETVVKVVYDTARRVSAGDIGFSGSGIGDANVYAINSVRIVAGKDYDALDWGENEENATIVDNKAQAYVYVNDVLTEVAAGTTVAIADYTTEAVAVMTTDGAKPAVDFVAEAGKAYEIVTKTDVEDFGINAGGNDLRLASNPGIRFKTSFARRHWGAYLELFAGGAITEFKVGTLVTTEAYRAEVDEFTAAKLDACASAVAGKTVYMDIAADATDLYTIQSFAGSIIGVKDYTRNYVAIGYVTVTFADGTSSTVYTAEQTASVVGFANAIVEAETPDYTGYTEAEIAALEYLAALDDVAA